MKHDSCVNAATWRRNNTRGVKYSATLNHAGLKLVTRSAKSHVRREFVRRSDRGVFAMKRVTATLLGCLVIGMATAASAFQEQQGSAGAPTAQQQPAQQPPAGKAVEVSTTTAGKPTTGGTEVRIPGLGKLGVLPKMDFGLELLYGANEPKVQDEERVLPSDDLTIRGTVKKTF